MIDALQPARRCRTLGLLAALWLAAGPLQAEDYPSRPIRIVNPFPAGGSGDSVARVVADKMAAALGTSVVVEARTGAAGVLGTDYVAKAPADGYTLILGTASSFGTASSTQKNLPYDAIRDFTPIVMLATVPYFLLVHPSVPVDTLPAFVAYAKANPGKLSYASFGNGSSNHLAYELFKQATGVDVVHVPYRGGAPAIQALIAGEVQSSMDVYATSYQQVQLGQLKLLGIAAARRSSLLPAAPTLAEQGVAVEGGTFFALLGPARLPAPIVARLNREANAALAMPEVRERLAALGTEVVGGTPQDLAATIAAEVDKWARLVRERAMTFE